MYVAQVAMGANDTQVLKAFLEAEAYDGPSLIIAYGHCIAHGIEMSQGLAHQKLAVELGYWPLYRFNPLRAAEQKNPLQLDSKEPSIPLRDYMYTEGRFSMLQKSSPEEAERLLAAAQADVQERWRTYMQMAGAGRPETSARV